MSISDLHLWLQQFFLQKTCFHGVSSRNYLILKTNETNQGHNIRSLVLNREANWTIFVLDRVRVWWPRRYTRFLSILAPPPGEPPPGLWPGYCGHVLSCPPLLLSLRHILSKKPLRFEFKLQRRWKKHTLTASLMASLLTDAILTLSNFCGTQLTTSPNEREPYLGKNDSSKNRQTRLTTRTRFSNY